jgi:hypothetical protein
MFPYAIRYNLYNRFTKALAFVQFNFSFSI